MTTTAPSPPELALHQAMQATVLRAFFGIGAGVCLLGVVFALLASGPLPAGSRPLMLLGYGSLALACAAGARLPPALAPRLLAPAVLAGLGVVSLVGLFTGWGLQTPGLIFFSLAVFLSSAISSVAVGRLGAVLALLVVLGLGGAEWAGWLPAPSGVPPLASRLAMHAAAILCGALMGRSVAQLLRQHLLAAGEREQRFLALLGIATHAYWETDAALRLTTLSQRLADGHFEPVRKATGRLLWEVPGLDFDEPTIDHMRADMERRATLHALVFDWQQGDGSQRRCQGSAEPRFDVAGRFIGYWGVARDVSSEHQAHQALAATEHRYHDLYNRIPTPLMLHRRGVVLDANPAAARLLGYASVDELLGHNLLTEHVTEFDRAAVQERMAQAENLAPGEVLPPRTMVFRTRSGGLVSVKATGVRADHDGQPAVLSISIDETEQRAAAQALSRSQALLARVVAMSPDIITLSNLHSGRYVMVNDSFCRLLGHALVDAQGKTSAELGLWHNPADRTQLLRALSEQGLVQDRLINFVTSAGRLLPLLVSATRLDADGQSYLLLNARDTSEATRVRLEREAILASASVGIAFTRQRRFVLANAQFERMYGWPVGLLAGRPLQALWSDAAHYETLQRELGPALARGEAVDVERQGQRRDGSRFQVRLRAKAIDPANPAESGTIWVAEDVTRARQTEQELARARDAAEAASRAKSAFLANTSHEIRTPLNGVLGLVRLARQPGLPLARQRQYLDQIAESAELLGAIISDILDLAKIEAGKLLLESAAFDLPALLRSLQQAHAALAASHGLAFEARLDPALPTWVRGDALRLRQVLSNFLHNALKFTTRGGIRLVVSRLPDERLRFEIHDTGPGIDAATQARLFEPFTQADESTTRQFGGTGLGLSICRELAHLMGGSVGLSSQPGQGSCFHLVLPLPALPDGEALLLPPEPVSGAALAGARVLLVEDNSVNMLIGVALLQHWGVLVTEASDGALALAAVDRAAAAGRPFDVVLMDVQMPGMSGHEATQALRLRYSAAQLPVIALTAAALVSERERAVAVGMNDFLTKPVDPERLLAALLRVLPTPPARGKEPMLNPA